MSDPKFLEDIAAKFSALIAASPAKDVEKNARAFITGAVARLDLVTRVEFDIQRDLLERASAKLAHLETRIAELEAQAGKPRL